MALKKRFFSLFVILIIATSSPPTICQTLDNENSTDTNSVIDSTRGLSNYEEEKPFELVFPAALQLAISKYTPVFNFPAGALALGYKNLQFGVGGTLNGFHGAGGSIKLFVSAHTSQLTIERKRAYFISLEGGSAFRKGRNNRTRLGLGFGYLYPIGQQEAPANLRLQLTPFLDFWNNQIEPGFSLGLGIGLPIGMPNPKPEKKPTP